MRVITVTALTALFAVTMGWLPISSVMEPTAPPEVTRQTRFERAAAQICGTEATWAQVADTTIQCLTKHGKKTRILEVK